MYDISKQTSTTLNSTDIQIPPQTLGGYVAFV